MNTDDLAWLDAGDYSFALGPDNKIIARNAAGRVLKTVPAKARKLPEFDMLDGQRVTRVTRCPSSMSNSGSFLALAGTVLSTRPAALRAMILLSGPSAKE